MSRHNTIKIIVFLLITGSLIFFSGSFLRDKGTDRLDASYRELPKNSLDVLFLGPSGLLNGIYPLELWDSYGVTAFNAASGNQSLAESYYILRDCLRRHTPELVVLEAAGVKADDTIVGTASLHYVTDTFSMFDPLKYKMVEECISGSKKNGLNTFEFYFPTYAYHSTWSEISSKNYSDVGREIMLGAKMHAVSNSNEECVTVGPDEKKEIPAVSEYYLRKILDLCKEKEIQLFLYISPTFQSKKSSINIYKTYNSLYDFASLHEVAFMNLNYSVDDIGINPIFDYADELHLNFHGAEKLTRWLGGVLCEKYMLKDHRNEKGYNYYDECYQKYVSYKSPKLLLQSKKSPLYLHALAEAKDNYTIIISVGDIIGHYLTQEMQKDLKALGLYWNLTEHRGWYSYIAIIDKGTVVYEDLGQVESTTGYKELTIRNHPIQIISSPLHAENKASIVIDDIDYAVNKRGLNIVVYDKEKEEVVDSVALDIHSKTLDFYRR